MTGAIAGAGSYPPPVPVASVQLHDQDCYKVSLSTATALYSIASSGKVVNQDSTILETWLLSGSNSAFEAMATLVSGTLTGGTTGSWIALNTGPTWFVSNSARNNSVKSVAMTVQIRDVATHTVQATATITLSAESDNNAR